jgi:hypothetical protein
MFSHTSNEKKLVHNFSFRFDAGVSTLNLQWRSAQAPNGHTALLGEQGGVLPSMRACPARALLRALCGAPEAGRPSRTAAALWRPRPLYA